MQTNSIIFFFRLKLFSHRTHRFASALACYCYLTAFKADPSGQLIHEKDIQLSLTIYPTATLNLPSDTVMKECCKDFHYFHLRTNCAAGHVSQPFVWEDINLQALCLAETTVHVPAAFKVNSNFTLVNCIALLCGFWPIYYWHTCPKTVTVTLNLISLFRNHKWYICPFCPNM